MTINKNITTQNWNSGTTSRIKYIVIHYTANDGDTSYANTNYFKSYRDASAHYFVDETSVWQSIEDKNIAWHCGANYYYHSECRNENSLGVELCSYINSSGNYAFKTGTVDNAGELVKELMAKYNVPIANIVRHYDVTHKVCPEPYVRDTAAWNSFKNRLTATTTAASTASAEIKEDEEMVETGTITVNGKDLKINKIVKDGVTYIKLRGLENAGFNVGYNADTKNLTLDNTTKDLSLLVDDNAKTVEAVNIGGYNYCQIRSLANATGAFDVDYTDGNVILRTK